MLADARVNGHCTDELEEMDIKSSQVKNGQNGQNGHTGQGKWYGSSTWN